jgi:hypothetical protein
MFLIALVEKLMPRIVFSLQLLVFSGNLLNNGMASAIVKAITP